MIHSLCHIPATWHGSHSWVTYISDLHTYTTHSWYMTNYYVPDQRIHPWRHLFTHLQVKVKLKILDNAACHELWFLSSILRRCSHCYWCTTWKISMHSKRARENSYFKSQCRIISTWDRRKPVPDTSNRFFEMRRAGTVAFFQEKKKIWLKVV